jgi:hypothetical protein
VSLRIDQASAFGLAGSLAIRDEIDQVANTAGREDAITKSEQTT